MPETATRLLLHYDVPSSHVSSSAFKNQERGERRGVARKVRMKQIDVEEVAALNRAKAEEAAAPAAQAAVQASDAQVSTAQSHEAQPPAARWGNDDCLYVVPSTGEDVTGTCSLPLLQSCYHLAHGHTMAQS